MTTLAATTQLDLLTIGLEIAGIALILGSFVLLLTGTSGPFGTSLRSALEPMLQHVRGRTPLSRAELADATILAGVGLAITAVVVEQRLLPGLVAVGLWLARPSVRRSTSEENRLRAVAGSFSLDVVIGFATPLAFAHFLFGDLLLGGSFLALVVALSWPAGGATIPGRRWRLTPVPVR